MILTNFLLFTILVVLVLNRTQGDRTQGAITREVIHNTIRDLDANINYLLRDIEKNTAYSTQISSILQLAGEIRDGIKGVEDNTRTRTLPVWDHVKEEFTKKVPIETIAKEVMEIGRILKRMENSTK